MKKTSLIAILIISTMVLISCGKRNESGKSSRKSRSNRNPVQTTNWNPQNVGPGQVMLTCTPLNNSGNQPTITVEMVQQNFPQNNVNYNGNFQYNYNNGYNYNNYNNYNNGYGNYYPYQNMGTSQIARFRYPQGGEHIVNNVSLSRTNSFFGTRTIRVRQNGFNEIIKYKTTRRYIEVKIVDPRGQSNSCSANYECY